MQHDREPPYIDVPIDRDGGYFWPAYKCATPFYEFQALVTPEALARFKDLEARRLLP